MSSAMPLSGSPFEDISVDETCTGGRGADAALTDHFPTENGVSETVPGNGHNV